tara:strand:- start:256 stop:522 length:267 start_codon:yes stop_codon:yes gene_type:complete
MIKPDGVQRGLVGKIIEKFEKRGFKLIALKVVYPTKETLESHYEEHKGKSFFNDIIKRTGAGPVCCMVWEGQDVIKTGRRIIGATNPT